MKILTMFIANEGEDPHTLSTMKLTEEEYKEMLRHNSLIEKIANNSCSDFEMATKKLEEYKTTDTFVEDMLKGMFYSLMFMESK